MTEKYNPLYTDDYEFKEQHASFLKRPAAVTIQKPCLQPSEMEDILVRTLRNYVPPKYVDKLRLPSLKGGLGIRAFAVFYDTNSTKQTFDVRDGAVIGVKAGKFSLESAKEACTSLIDVVRGAANNDSISTTLKKSIKVLSSGKQLLSALVIPGYNPFSSLEFKKINYTYRRPIETVTAGDFQSESDYMAKTAAQAGYTSLSMLSTRDTIYNENTQINKNAVPYLVQPIKWNETIIFSNDVPQNFANNVNTKNGDSYKVEEEIKHNNAVFGKVDASANKVSSNKEIAIHNQSISPNGVWVDMYLLSEQDHKEMLLDKSDNHATNKVLYLHNYLFRNGELPVYCGTCDLAEVLPEDTIQKAFGNKKIYGTLKAYKWSFLLENGPTTSEDARFAYVTTVNNAKAIYNKLGDELSFDGFIHDVDTLTNTLLTLCTTAISTNNVESFYYISNDYLGTAGQNSGGTVLDKVRNAVAAIKQAGVSNTRTYSSLQSQVTTLTGALQQLDSAIRKSRVFKYKVAKENAQPVTAETSTKQVVKKIASDAVNLTRAVANPVFGLFNVLGLTIQAKSNAEVAQEAAKLNLNESKKLADTLDNALAEQQAKILDSTTKLYQKAVDNPKATLNDYVHEEDEKTVPEIAQLYKQINDFNITSAGKVGEEDYWLHRNYHGVVPFLPITDRNTKSRRTEQQSVMNAITDVNRVEPNNPVDMPMVDFKVRYYSILLTRLKAKLDHFHTFIEDGIMKFPLMEVFYKAYNLVTSASSYAESRTQGKPADKNDEETTDERTRGNAFLKKLSFEEKKLFCEWCEAIFFSPVSGIFITSFATNDKSSVRADLWNAKPTLESLSDITQDDERAKRLLSDLLTFGNFDVSTANISRVMQGVSNATLTIKNDKDKYSFDRDDVYNRSSVCIEPMDTIVIYLPDLNGKLHHVFTGIINNVSAINDGGYHSLQVSADCNLKLLRINRTNVKPSLSRQENENNPITAFNFPNHLFATIETWMPYIFAESLSYIYCMPKQTTYANKDEKLYTLSNDISKEYRKTVTVDVYKLKEASCVPVSTKLAKLDTSTYKRNSDGTMSGVNPSYKQDIEETRYIDRLITESTGSTRKYTLVPNKPLVVVNFNDTLFQYLWYKSASKMPKIELDMILKAHHDLLAEYSFTKIIYGNVGNNDYKDSSVELEKEEPGIIELKKILADGNRCSYGIYKQRFDGTSNRYITSEEDLDKPDYSTLTEQRRDIVSKINNSIDDLTNKLQKTFNKVQQKLLGSATQQADTSDAKSVKFSDREVVANITGTSQPNFMLQGQGQSLQVSNWQTNLTLIQNSAAKLNFCLYCDSSGVVRFTPYRFDLTPLVTQNNKYDISSHEVIYGMFVTMKDIQLENTDNPFVLKKRFITSYEKSLDDKSIINWLRLSGSWIVGKNELQQIVVSDPVLIKKYGVRTGSPVHVTGASGANALKIYGLSYLDRQNKRLRSARISGLFDSRMDVNITYYVPHDEIMYLCESLNIKYIAGSTCTYTMGAAYGRQPLLSLENFLVSDKISDAVTLNFGTSASVKNTNSTTLSAALDKLFLKNNEIAPSVYAQYMHAFDNAGKYLETINAAYYADAKQRLDSINGFDQAAVDAKKQLDDNIEALNSAAVERRYDVFLSMTNASNTAMDNLNKANNTLVSAEEYAKKIMSELTVAQVKQSYLQQVNAVPANKLTLDSLGKFSLSEVYQPVDSKATKLLDYSYNPYDAEVAQAQQRKLDADKRVTDAKTLVEKALADLQSTMEEQRQQWLQLANDERQTEEDRKKYRKLYEESLAEYEKQKNAIIYEFSTMQAARRSKIEANNRYCTVCCFNGYLWNNVSGITFEELVYDYYWLLDGTGVNNFKIAIASDTQTGIGKVNQDLAANNMYVTTSGSNIYERPEVAARLRQFFVEVPAISDDLLPEQIANIHWTFTDLTESPLVGENDAQLIISKEKSETR